MGKNKYTTISIPEPLGMRLKEFIDGSGFTSMSDFVTFLLRDILSDEKYADSSYDEQKKKIRSRLKALGYID